MNLFPQTNSAPKTSPASCRGWPCIVWALLLLSNSSGADQFTLDWWDTCAGGTCSGGAYTLSSSIGQPDAGTLTGGNFTLSGGFWSVITASPPPVPAPALNILLTATNTFVISWPSPSTGFVLEQCGDLADSIWSEPGLTPADNGTMRSVVVPAGSGTRFYRLRK